MDAIKQKRPAIVKRFISDVIIIGSGGIILLLFRFLGDPFKQGFFCNDDSLKHPFRDSTVTSGMLYGIGFALGFILIVTVETLWSYCNKTKDPLQLLDIDTYGKFCILIRDVYLSLIPFLFGAVTEHIVTDIGKYGVGRLRPHFFDVCKVDFSMVNCSQGYIETFQCTGADANAIREVRLSFPSGHASFSCYVAVYLMIYLQRRLTFLFKSLIRPTLQTILFVLAYYTCLSRVTDYKHHPTDVLAGAVIGGVVAVLVAYSVSDLFSISVSRDSVTDQYKTLNKGEESSSVTAGTAVTPM